MGDKRMTLHINDALEKMPCTFTLCPLGEWCPQLMKNTSDEGNEIGPYRLNIQSAVLGWIISLKVNPLGWRTT